MQLLELATLFNLTGITAVLSMSGVMLWRHPSPFFRSWTSGYACMALMLAVDLAGTHFGRSTLLIALEAGFALALIGCFWRVGRELRGDTLKAAVIASVAVLGALVTAGLSLVGIPFTLLSVPIILAMLGTEIMLGFRLARKGVDGIPAPWLGIPFILLALATLSYPFIVETPYFWLGFWLTGLFNILVGMGMALYLLEVALSRLRAQHEKLLHLDQLKRSFLSTVSHELRTPLTGMVGNLEFLEDGLGGPLTAEQAHFVQEVQRGASQLSELVNSLLDTVQMEAGALKVKRETVDLRILLTQAQQAMQAVATRQGLRLELSLPDDLPLVAGDGLRLSQVMSNLLSNAVKFTPDGGRIRIEAVPCPEGVRIVVSDTGIGIPPAAAPRLFDPFYQVDASLTRQYRGSGLGLAIVKTLVEAMGGTIAVASQPGEGSTFSVTLPLADAPCAPVS